MWIAHPLSTDWRRVGNTHTSPVGAALNAACVAAGLRALPDCQLKDYLLPDPN